MNTFANGSLFIMTLKFVTHGITCVVSIVFEKMKLTANWSLIY